MIIYLIIGFILFILMLGSFSSDSPGFGCLILIILVISFLWFFIPWVLPYISLVLRFVWHFISDYLVDLLSLLASNLYDYISSLFNQIIN